MYTLISHAIVNQEFPNPSSPVPHTSFKSHGFSLLDARHLVPLVSARYPFSRRESLTKTFTGCYWCFLFLCKSGCGAVCNFQKAAVNFITRCQCSASQNLESFELT